MWSWKEHEGTRWIEARELKSAICWMCFGEPIPCVSRTFSALGSPIFEVRALGLTVYRLYEPHAAFAAFTPQAARRFCGLVERVAKAAGGAGMKGDELASPEKREEIQKLKHIQGHGIFRMILVFKKIKEAHQAACEVLIFGVD